MYCIPISTPHFSQQNELFCRINRKVVTLSSQEYSTRTSYDISVVLFVLRVLLVHYRVEGQVTLVLIHGTICISRELLILRFSFKGFNVLVFRV